MLRMQRVSRELRKRGCLFPRESMVRGVVSFSSFRNPICVSYPKNCTKFKAGVEKSSFTKAGVEY